MNQAAAIIRETAHPDANIIFGAVIDPAMGDAMRITVIATGFEREQQNRRMQVSRQLKRRPNRPAERPTHRPAENNNPPEQTPRRESESASASQSQSRFSPNDIDIPAFLRKR